MRDAWHGMIGVGLAVVMAGCVPVTPGPQVTPLGGTKVATEEAPSPVVPTATVTYSAPPGELEQIGILGRGVPVRAVWLPDGKSVAAVSGPGVWIFDAGNFNADPRLLAAEDQLTSLAVSPDGTLIAAGDYIGTIIVWDAQTGEERGRIHAHSEQISALAFSGDSALLASAGWDGSIRVWDVQTGEMKYIQSSNLSNTSGFTDQKMALSPTGSLLAFNNRDADGINTVLVWDYSGGDTPKEFKTEQGMELGDIAFSPDGSLLAVPLGAGNVQIWDVARGEIIQDLHVNVSRGPNGEDYGLSTEPVNTAAFSPDSRLLATGGAYRGAIGLWDVSTGEQTATLQDEGNGEQGMTILSLDFSPDGSKIAAVDTSGRVQIRDAATDTVQATLGGFTTSLGTIAISPDGTRLAAGSGDTNGQIYVWDIKTREQMYALAAHTRQVSGLGYSPDGATLASTSLDQKVRLWDATTGAPGDVYQGFIQDANSNNWIYGSAYSPDGATLAVTGDEALAGVVWLWTGGAQEPERLEGFKSFRSVAISPDGKLIAAGDLTGEVTVWDFATRAQKASLIPPGASYSMSATHLAFSPDGTMLAEAIEDQPMIVWDLATGKPLPTNDLFATSLTFSPAGALVTVYVDQIMVIDLASGRITAQALGGPGMADVAVSADGRTVAVACDDGTVRLWALK